MIGMVAACIAVAACSVAFANGANANFKGVASLFGSGTTRYGTAVAWSTLATAAGCLAAAWTAHGLLAAFSGKGLVPDGLVADPRFLLSVASGAGLANLLATVLGFPVSTTHLLVGGLLGAGLADQPSNVDFRRLWEAFVRPLLLAPVLALAVGGILHRILRRLGLAPDRRHRVLDVLHFLSAGAVCFSRGLNDAPKMAALLVGVAGLGVRPSLLTVLVLMAAGGLLAARRVAETLAHGITGMNPGEGLSANLATAVLTTTASLHGLPVSTTHVSVGALLGIGITTRQTRWKTAIPVLLAWVATLPCAALMSALFWWILQGTR